MVKIGICDDESAVHTQVEQYILNEDFGDAVEVISFLDAKDLLEYDGFLDILLLDIFMPEMDGIAVGHLVNKQKKVGKIIMLTAMRERFQEAFEIEAYRFVTKPIAREKLVKAVRDAVRTFIGNTLIEVYRGNIKHSFSQKEIIYISKLQSRTEVIIGANEYQSPQTLEDWEKELDGRLFFRIHRSYIVNMSQIDRIGDKIYLLSGEILTLSKRKKKSFMQAYMQYDLNYR